MNYRTSIKNAVLKILHQSAVVCIESPKVTRAPMYFVVRFGNSVDRGVEHIKSCVPTYAAALPVGLITVVSNPSDLCNVRLS